MRDSGDLDFSFSGIKTALRYALEKLPELTHEIIAGAALEFENAVTEVLVKKTLHALDETGAQAFILGGGVSANSHLRKELREQIAREYPDVAIYLPDPKLSTDNALMIALAGHARAADALTTPEQLATLSANGNRSLSK
jgi:N6-L-threonylcarbamoyladenine synthase